MATTTKPQIIEYINHTCNYTVLDTMFIPCSAKIVVLGTYPRGTGVMHIMELNEGKLQTVQEIEKKSPFRTGTFAASTFEERHLATGDLDGRMSVWDLQRPDLPVYTVKGHEGIIHTIDGVAGLGIGKGAPEILTGGQDGCVKVWDVRQKDVPVAAFEPAPGQKNPECWAAAFGHSYNEEDRCIAAGYDNGDVKLYDLRMNTVAWEENVQNGVCSVQFDRKDIQMNKLLVTTLEGRFSVFDLRTHHPQKGYASLVEKPTKSTIWCGRHLPQSRDIFMVTGGAGTLHLYKYKYPQQRKLQDSDGLSYGVIGSVEKLNQISLSTQPISSFSWSTDKEGLCVYGAYDQTVRVGFVTRLRSFY
eukprot:TRINITY_DN6683_c0_g2_i2.p1 TRINITY_DN6683_c0_g2~~TRINITY_DN6683_c0_g2_i2.p1  ORF type:complete len:359 (+),score=65.62 TRINITY_DN6683_c0_g2_i2:73-1149(+)